MATAEKFSAKQAAIQLGTDARTLRKFIRASDEFEAVGQGNRYEFTAKEIKGLKKKFEAWSTGKGKKVKTKSTAEVIDPDAGKTNEELDADLDAYVEETSRQDREDEEPDEAYDLEELTGPDEDELIEIELDDEDL